LGWLLTWATVVLGWAIVSDQQNHRELRKDRSARLSELRDEIAEIEVDAIAFHTSASFDRAKALALIRRLAVLSREFSFLGKCEYLSGDCSQTQIEFKKACTGTNFDLDPLTFQTQLPEAPLLGDIMRSRDALDDFVAESLTQNLTSSKSVLASAHSIWSYVPESWAAAKDGFRRHRRNDDSDSNGADQDW